MKQVFVKPLLLLLVILAAASCDKDEKEIGYDALAPKGSAVHRTVLPRCEMHPCGA